MRSGATHVKRKIGMLTGAAHGVVYSAAMGKKVSVIVDVVELGRLGGRATAESRSPEERAGAASDAAKARWAEYYRKHPEKLRAKQERTVAAARKKKLSTPKRRARR